MFDLSQRKIESQVTMLTGTPGTRKSTQALTWPKPQYWFSWDGKMDSLILPMIKWGINPKDIQADDYFDWNTAKAKLESFVSSAEGFNPTKPPYKSIVIDSITSCGDAILTQTMDLKRGGTRKSGAEAGKRVAGIAVNEIEDYMAESSALMELISLCRKIHKIHGINIILIAHVIQAEYKSTPGGPSNMVRTVVTAGKRVAPRLPAYAHEVYHFYVGKSFNEGEGKFSCLTVSTGDDFARTGLDLPSKIEFGDEPLYDKWIKPAIDKLNNSL